MQVQNCTKHSPARQGEECPKCQIDYLRAVNAELLEALELLIEAYPDENQGMVAAALTIARG